MTRIPPNDRWFPTEDELLATCARFSVQAYRAGNVVFFVAPGSPEAGHVRATLISPQEAVRFVRDWRYEGEPILRFIGSVSRPSRLSVTWTDAGRRWKNAQAQWGGKPRRRLSARAWAARARRQRKDRTG
jgi:hypothetical protein